MNMYQTDIVNQNKWEPLQYNDVNKSFQILIDKVTQLDNQSDNQYVKWKTSSSSQVVIQSENYFYKLYEIDFIQSKWLCDIRNALAEIYREDYGIVWNVETVEIDGLTYQLEQREKLQLCTPELISFDNLLIDWSYTLDKLEKKLGLHKIHLQLRNQIENLGSIKLIRDCVNKYIDYGYKNGHVILLDDADWFIAVLDKDHKWISPKFNAYPIVYDGNDMIFCPCNFYESKAISSTDKICDKWSILDIQPESLEYSKRHLVSARERMLQNNINIICDKSTKSISNIDVKNLTVDYTVQQVLSNDVKLLT